MVFNTFKNNYKRFYIILLNMPNLKIDFFITQYTNTWKCETKYGSNSFAL